MTVSIFHILASFTTPMQIDRQMLVDSTDTWMKYWDANIRNSERGK